MKANQKFVSADEAVSPVIGVILMVAITVVLAAVVFVLVSDLGDTGDAAEQASVTVDSQNSKQVSILLVTEGKNADYNAVTDGDVVVTIDGVACEFDGTAVAPADNYDRDDSSWGAGEALIFDGDTETVDTGCGAELVAGDAQVVVTILGTVVFNGEVTIKA